MGLKSDGPAYTLITCPGYGCGRRQIIATWKLNPMARDAGVEVQEWSYEWFGARMRCTKCGHKGMELSVPKW